MTRSFIFCAGIFFICLALAGLSPAGAALAPTPADSSGWFIDLTRFSESAHRDFTCEACHGNMKETGKKHPDTEEMADLAKEAARLYDYRRCRSCHRESYERYLRGAHAKALVEQEKASAPENSDTAKKLKAPTCGDCHAAHYGKAHLSRAAMGKQMTAVCGVCHPAQKTTYLDNYHGKAGVNLGDDASAYCTDCHGAHDCISLKDPKAALAACQRCHPEAGKQFAEFVIHPTKEGMVGENKAKEKRVAIIHVVTLIMTMIVILVVGFFYGHSFLWLLREIHEKLRRHQKE